MLDLRFCDNSPFRQFNEFKISEDLGSDYKITITTFQPNESKIFRLKSKINCRLFRENATKLLQMVKSLACKVSKNNELNHFSSSLVEFLHKSLEDSCINKKEFPCSVITQKLIKLMRRRRRELKIGVGAPFASLGREFNYLQKEIKWSMRRPEDQKRAKVLESACDKGGNVFWKSIKELTNENEPTQK